jgi:ATPase subunit of ABC transporter with duplicated ATPase domains
MITEITGAVATVNSAVGSLKTLLKVGRDEEVRTAVFEIQNELLNLQAKLFEANARFEEQSAKIDDLRRQLGERDRWDEEAKKYDLFHPAQGMSVYKLRSNYNQSGGEIRACPSYIRRITSYPSSYRLRATVSQE